MQGGRSARAGLLAVAIGCGGPPATDDLDATETSAPGSTGADDGDPNADASADTDAPTSDTTDGSGDDDPPPVQPVPGLFARYYADYHDAVIERVEPTLDAGWGLDAPDPALAIDRFSARWTGWLTAPTTDTYTIATETDDGVRVWVDGALVIDDWTPHYVTRNTAEVVLVGDVPVPIRVEYFEIDIEASARLLWSSATMAESIVPTSALSTDPAPPPEPGPKPPYLNPVVPFDCPDPGVIAVPDAAQPGYYMVCTGGSFPIRYSRDLVMWQDAGAAILPAGKPAWANNGFRNWAPEIHRVAGKFVAYFTSVNAADQLCIGAAVADAVTGPYVDQAGPLVEHPQGVIDATFVMTEAPYLVYKIDGNAFGQPTPILARALTDDGLAFAPGSTPVQLLVNDPGTWEGGVVEAQWIVQRDGMFYMFYSGNVYDHRYRTGVARALSITGPWEKHGPPILANNERWVGPGHGTVLVVDGIDYFFFHAWTNAGNGTHDTAAGRHGLVDRIDWVDGWPQIHDGTPSRTLQPWPGGG